MKLVLTPARRAGMLLVLVCTLIGSAIAVAYSGYMNRQSFFALKNALADNTELKVTFGRLELEKSSWVSPAVVQALAEQRLGMRAPTPDRSVVILSAQPEPAAKQALSGLQLPAEEQP